MNKVVISALLLGLSSCNSESDFCNYVEVENEKQFTGEWLQYASAIKHKTLKKDECIYFDKLLDNGDGNKVGKVRWANCLSGPDCNEAGMY